MERPFSPLQPRALQLATFGECVKNALHSDERDAWLRYGKRNFAFILKRNHANFTLHPRGLRKPLEHIEVILAMPSNWQKDFASIPLTENDKAPLQQYRESLEENPLEALENILGAGFKVSVVWSENSHSFIVSVIGTDRCKHNASKVLSSFSDDISEAFFMAGYKVFHVMPNQEWPTQQEQSRWG